jgi:PPP family 3-phenylpropionic acid transporter
MASIGIDASGVAILFAVNATTALFCGQLVGYLADKYFSRRDLLFATTLLVSPIFALFPLIPPRLDLLILWTGLFSATYSQRVSLYNSLIFDSRQGEMRFGRIRLVGSAGFAVVTVLTGWLAGFGALGPAVMWPILVVIELLFALCLFKVRDYTPEVRRGRAVNVPGFRAVQQLLLSNVVLRRFLVFVFLFQFIGAPLHLLQAGFLGALGSTALVATASFAIAAFAEMIVFFYGNQITARASVVRLLALVPLALFVRYGLVAIFPIPWVILATSTLHIIGFGLAYLCCVVFINRETPTELKASGQTLFGLVFSFVSGLLGHLAAAGFLRYVEDRLGASPVGALRALYGTGAILALVALAAWWPMYQAHRERR